MSYVFFPLFAHLAKTGKWRMKPHKLAAQRTYIQVPEGMSQEQAEIRLYGLEGAPKAGTLREMLNRTERANSDG